MELTGAGEYKRIWKQVDICLHDPDVGEVLKTYLEPYTRENNISISRSSETPFVRGLVP